MRFKNKIDFIFAVALNDANAYQADRFCLAFACTLECCMKAVSKGVEAPSGQAAVGSYLLQSSSPQIFKSAVL